MARHLRSFGGRQAGLEQYAIAQFADALEVVPRTIAENSGASAPLPARCPVCCAMHCSFKEPIQGDVTNFRPSVKAAAALRSLPWQGEEAWVKRWRWWAHRAECNGCGGRADGGAR